MHFWLCGLSDLIAKVRSSFVQKTQDESKMIPGVNRATAMYTVQLYILNGSTTKSIYHITSVIAGLAIMKGDCGSFVKN